MSINCCYLIAIKICNKFVNIIFSLFYYYIYIEQNTHIYNIKHHKQLPTQLNNNNKSLHIIKMIKKNTILCLCYLLLIKSTYIFVFITTDTHQNLHNNEHFKMRHPLHFMTCHNLHMIIKKFLSFLCQLLINKINHNFISNKLNYNILELYLILRYNSLLKQLFQETIALGTINCLYLFYLVTLRSIILKSTNIHLYKIPR